MAGQACHYCSPRLGTGPPARCLQSVFWPHRRGDVMARASARQGHDSGGMCQGPMPEPLLAWPGPSGPTRARQTRENSVKMVKTGLKWVQNWSKLVKTGQKNWSFLGQSTVRPARGRAGIWSKRCQFTVKTGQIYCQNWSI